MYPPASEEIMNVWRYLERCVLALVLLMVPMSSGAGSSDERDWSVEHRRLLASIEADVARNRHVLGRSQLSPSVRRAMTRVERHLFVPHRYRDLAYSNQPLPIGHGQTISQPTIVALMTDLMNVDKGDTVLEVGTGSGYQAAVLAEVAAMVHTIEIVPALADHARQTLQDLGYENIRVYTGDGYQGLPEAAPFAAIMVTAAPEEVPAPLLEQLATGGRLVIPVGPRSDTQWLEVWTRGADGSFSRERVLAVRFVPMTGRAEERR
jgi:protein-L-isoaspartate(D-aspartate) O-methyltransferase